MPNGKGGLAQLQKPEVKPEQLFKWKTYALVRDHMKTGYLAVVYSDKKVTETVTRNGNAILLGSALKGTKNAKVFHYRIGKLEDKQWNETTQLPLEKIVERINDKVPIKYKDGTYVEDIYRTAYSSFEGYRNMQQKGDRPIYRELFQPIYQQIGESQEVRKIIPKRRKRSS